MTKIVMTLIYSISFIMLWGLFLVDVDLPGTFGIIFCLVYTYYADLFFRKEIVFESKYTQFLKFLFPVFYLIAALFNTEYSFLNFLLHPILTANIILIIGNQLTAINEKYSVQFFVISYIFLYSLALHPIWQQQNIVNEETESYDFSIDQKEIKNIDIKTVSFIKSDDTTFLIRPEEKYVLLETWNEKCPPCFSAIQDLSDFFDQQKQNILHYYVYEAPDKRLRTDHFKVFNFEKIADKKKILIDKDNNLFNLLNLKGNPYFLLFDQNGQLIYQYFGYHHSVKDELTNVILSITKK